MDILLIINLLFVLCVIFLLYVTVLYPIILAVISKIVKNDINYKNEFEPEITVIIAAYNEEEYIHDAIESVAKCDYPYQKINIIVGSDGSNDKTLDVVRGLSDKYGRISWHEFNRIGKNRVLNNLVPLAKTEIVYFMDADLRLNKDTFSKSVGYFADTEVGGVMSKLNIISDESDENLGAAGEGMYQKYEVFIRNHESAIHTSVNSFGLYGVRKEYLDPVPNDFVCDDLFNVLTIALHRKKFLFREDSAVSEVRKKSLGEELNRRVRLAAGGLSTVFARKTLFSPSYGWAWFFFLSHKVFRYFLPLALLALAVITVPMLRLNSQLAWVAISGQVLFYGLAIIGNILEKMSYKPKLFRIPLFFLTMNIGFVLGWIRVLSHGQNSTWERMDTK